METNHIIKRAVSPCHQVREYNSGQEKIIFSPNKHFLNQQSGNEEERITDTSFMIQGKEGAEHIAVKYDSVREGVRIVMVGKVLEYEAKTIKREGIKEGIEQGIEQGIVVTVSILKKLGIPSQTILAEIQEQYDLSFEAAKKYL